MQKYIVQPGKEFTEEGQDGVKHTEGDVVELDTESSHTQWAVENGLIVAQDVLAPTEASLHGSGTVSGDDIIEGPYIAEVQYAPTATPEQISSFQPSVKEMLDELESEPSQIPDFITSITIKRNQ